MGASQPRQSLAESPDPHPLPRHSRVAVIAALRRNKSAINDEYAGLDVGKLQESLGGGEPHMKETTAMIRAGHQFVQDADRELLTRIDLDAFAREALASHLRPLDLAERKIRSSDLWGQDRERRLRVVLNLLRSQGMTIDTEKSNGGAEQTIDQLVDLRPREVLEAIGCN